MLVSNALGGGKGKEDNEERERGVGDRGRDGRDERRGRPNGMPENHHPLSNQASCENDAAWGAAGSAPRPHFGHKSKAKVTFRNARTLGDAVEPASNGMELSTSWSSVCCSRSTSAGHPPHHLRRCARSWVNCSWTRWAAVSFETVSASRISSLHPLRRETAPVQRDTSIRCVHYGARLRGSFANLAKRCT